MATRKTLIQLTAEKRGITDITTASTAGQYIIYKETLIEIERIFRNVKIARQSLVNIEIALNDIINGFQDLRRNTEFDKKKDIIRVVEHLNNAQSDLQYALQEWRPEKKSRDHFPALLRCKESIFQVNNHLA